MVFLEILQNSQGNTRARVSFLIKLQSSACNFIKKKTLVQVFSCEFGKFSKNTFLYRTPPVAASGFPTRSKKEKGINPIQYGGGKKAPLPVFAL